MPQADEQKPDGGFDPPPPSRLRSLVIAVAGISLLFALFALAARLLLHH